MFPDITFGLNYEWYVFLCVVWQQLIPSPVADLFVLLEPNKSLNKQTNGCDYHGHSAYGLVPTTSRADNQYNSTPSCVILLK